ncbi:hypothetical protein QEG73_23405 [Chitinophagaceae bacterium 26-R-25]|nr:hypothetical protein [Chitinophagaceae bacterium 26-R-25]
MDKSLEIIKDKIENIGSAIMYSMPDTVLKLPTQIVNTLCIDDLGHVWFLVPKPVQHVALFDRIFPVKLSYFKKGINTSLSINGLGEMILDPEVINTVTCIDDELREKAHDKSMLVRVKIEGVEMFEPTARKNNLWAAVSNFFMETLFPFHNPSRGVIEYKIAS